MDKRINLICIVFLFYDLTYGDVYTGLLKFKPLLDTQYDVGSKILEYVESEKDRLEKLTQIAHEYQRSSTKSLENIENYLANPLNAFLLIKRLTADWEKIKKLMDNIDTEKVFPPMPTHTDLEGSARALMRLQDTYKLDTGDMARAEIKGVVDKQPLTADDCFQIGRIAYSSKGNYH